MTMQMFLYTAFVALVAGLFVTGLYVWDAIRRQRARRKAFAENKPIGRITGFQTNEEGIFVTAIIDDEDVLALLKLEPTSGLSIGYDRYADKDWDTNEYAFMREALLADGMIRPLGPVTLRPYCSGYVGFLDASHKECPLKGYQHVAHYIEGDEEVSTEAELGWTFCAGRSDYHNKAHMTCPQWNVNHAPHHINPFEAKTRLDKDDSDKLDLMDETLEWDGDASEGPVSFSSTYHLGCKLFDTRTNSTKDWFDELKHHPDELTYVQMDENDFGEDTNHTFEWVVQHNVGYLDAEQLTKAWEDARSATATFIKVVCYKNDRPHRHQFKFSGRIPRVWGNFMLVWTCKGCGTDAVSLSREFWQQDNVYGPELGTSIRKFEESIRKMNEAWEGKGKKP